jgi:hypothetical protein
LDRYLHAGRLRVRRITHYDGPASEYKLCEAYGLPEPVSEPTVDVYLTAKEHAVFVLPGRPVRKRRHAVRHDGRACGVGNFEDASAGLVACRAEAPMPEGVRVETEQ